MKKFGSFLRGVMQLFLMVSAIVLAGFFISVNLGMQELTPSTYWGRIELQEYYGMKAEALNMAWNRISAIMYIIIIILYIFALCLKGVATRKWLCNFSTWLFVVVAAGYVFCVNYHTKSFNDMTIPLCVSIVVGIIFCVSNRMSYKRMQLKGESAFEGARALVLFASIATGMVAFGHFGIIRNCVSKEVDKAYIEFKIEEATSLLDFYNTEAAYDEPTFETKYKVAFVNTFCDEEEKFTMEEVVEGYINLVKGEGSWYRLVEYTEKYHEIYDVYNKPPKSLLHSFHRKVKKKVSDAETVKEREDYTLEELESLMEETYLEMEKEFKITTED